MARGTNSALLAWMRLARRRAFDSPVPIPMCSFRRTFETRLASRTLKIALREP